MCIGEEAPINSYNVFYQAIRLYPGIAAEHYTGLAFIMEYSAAGAMY
jgi:hypothetical protein